MHTVEQAEKMIYDDPIILERVVVCSLDSNECNAFRHLLELVRAQDDTARTAAAGRLHTAIQQHIHQHAVGAVEMQKIRILLETPINPNAH